MDFGTFLADDTLGGSWADQEVDMASISVPTAVGTTTPLYLRQDGTDFETKDRVEYPVPEAPPYRSRVGNLPYEATEDALARFFEDRLQAHDIVTEVKLPMDNLSGKIKGFAFVTFSEKSFLEKALRLSISDFQGRKIFVNVAAPQKQDVFDLDWRSARPGPLARDRRDREPRELVNLDWSAARGSGPSNRERSETGDRFDRPERRFREEPDLDWSSARSSGSLPPRDGSKERAPRREEPDLDWSSARGGAGPLPHKERKPRREEPDLDWSAARSAAPLPPKERVVRKTSDFGLKKKDEKEFDWKRGQKSPGREKPPAPKEEEEQKKPQKFSYNVLAIEDDDRDEEKAEKTGLEQPVAEMSV